MKYTVTKSGPLRYNLVGKESSIIFPFPNGRVKFHTGNMLVYGDVVFAL